jgi:hypothetical protein
MATVDQPLLCVVHIPKTAGSAIRETLISGLGFDKVYWIGHKRPYAHWDNADGTEFDDFAVVGGHRSAESFRKIKRPKIFMTVVRDPVWRAISLFNYITRGPDPNHSLRSELEGLSLVEAIEKSEVFRREIENRQCALLGEEPTFSAALHSICRDQWIIDRHENVDKLFGELCDRFGWPKLPLVLDNVAEPGYARRYLSPETTTALTELNQEDYRLVSVFAQADSGCVTPATPLARIAIGAFCSTPVIDLIEPGQCVNSREREAEVRQNSLDFEQGSSVAQVVTAIYNATLDRGPDAGGLVAYGNLFKGVPAAEGVERAVRLLLCSEEFQSKLASRTQERPIATVPQAEFFTEEQFAWLGSLLSNPRSLLVARFRAAPGERPRIYAADRSLLDVPRVVLSIRYIDDLVSRYLLGTEYYHLHAEIPQSEGNDSIFILQFDDKTAEIPNTVGYCGTGRHTTLIPDPHFWGSKGYFDQREAFRKHWQPWRTRNRVVFWRGSTTGPGNISLDSVRHLSRFRLCAAGANGSRFAGVLDAKLTNIVQARSKEEAKMIQSFAEGLGIFAAPVPQIEFLKYRFQVDIDGNSNSWSFLLKLLMGSCILKIESRWRQWYYADLRPWQHYVPVQSDLSDLEERIGWCLANDESAREIAVNGMTYASRIVFGTEMPRAAAMVLRASQAGAGSPFA